MFRYVVSSPSVTINLFHETKICEILGFFLDHSDLGDAPTTIRQNVRKH
jgi:hypothetical protein